MALVIAVAQVDSWPRWGKKKKKRMVLITLKVKEKYKVVCTECSNVGSIGDVGRSNFRELMGWKPD